MRRSIPAARSSLRLIVLATLVAFLATSHAPAQTVGVPPVFAARLQTALDAARERLDVIGVAASVVSARHGSWVGASGMSDPATGETIANDMLFGMGSVTKTFTAAAILQLADEGRLALDDTIGTWISGFANIDGGITIRQLLAHTSGVASYTDVEDFWFAVNADLDHHFMPEELLAFVGPRRFAPGADWSYSNTGYVLLGMIIERISGRTYEEEIERRLLTPLGLDSIAMGSDDPLPGIVVGNHVDTDGDGDLDNFNAFPRRALYSSAWAAGGLMTTLEDLALWGSKLYSGALLSPASMTAMTTFRSVPELGPGVGYGLGAIRMPALGRTGWGHTGGIPGFTTILVHIPADSVTVAVIVNDGGGTTSLIALDLLRVYFQNAAAPRSEHRRAALAAHPNPFTDRTTITLDAPVRVTIHDALGRRVRTIEARAREVAWDGRDENGTQCPAGVYVVRIGSGDEMLVVRSGR